MANDYKFLVQSTLASEPGSMVGLSVIPFDIHIMHKEAK